MEITDLRWLERKPTWQAFAEEKLNYKFQLLVENLSAVGSWINPQRALDGD